MSASCPSSTSIVCLCCSTVARMDATSASLAEAPRLSSSDRDLRSSITISLALTTSCSSVARADADPALRALSVATARARDRSWAFDRSASSS